MVDQWLHNPLGFPSLGGQRDTTTINYYATYPSQYINILNCTIKIQTQIGWMNLTKGFLATTWHELASTYFSNPEDPITQRDDGSHRIANAIRAITTKTYTFYLARTQQRSSSTKRGDTHSPAADSHRRRDRTTSCRQLCPPRCQQTLL